jgi:hypothetical protein
LSSEGVWIDDDADCEVNALDCALRQRLQGREQGAHAIAIEALNQLGSLQLEILDAL